MKFVGCFLNTEKLAVFKKDFADCTQQIIVLRMTIGFSS